MKKETSLSEKIKKELKESKDNFIYFHSLCEKETAEGRITFVTHGKRCEAIGRLQYLKFIDKELNEAVKRLKERIDTPDHTIDCSFANIERIINEIFGPSLTGNEGDELT